MRLTINVDLNENELLEEQVLKAVKAEARKVAREAVNREISSEIERIIGKLFEDKSSRGYKSNLERRVEGEITFNVDKYVKEILGDIKTKVNEKLVEERIEVVLCDVDARVDNVIGRRLDRAGFGGDGKSLISYIRGLVENSVKSLVPETLLKLLVSGMDGKEA